jgi:hypothetical protein
MFWFAVVVHGVFVSPTTAAEARVAAAKRTTLFTTPLLLLPSARTTTALRLDEEVRLLPAVVRRSCVRLASWDSWEDARAAIVIEAEMK